MVRPIPGRPTFQQIARRSLRGFAVRTLRGLGDTLLTNSLVQLAQNAGFTGNDANIAAAIAMAESSGIPTKYNPEVKASGGTPQGQGSYGLWQIYVKKHPQFAGWNLYDPQTNANAAYSVYQNEGWTAWTTFKTGAYKQYLPATVAQQPVEQPAPPLTIDATTGKVVTDYTPTPLPDDDVTAAYIPPAAPSAPNVLLLTGLAVGAYLLADTLFGD